MTDLQPAVYFPVTYHGELRATRHRWPITERHARWQAPTDNGRAGCGATTNHVAHLLSTVLLYAERCQECYPR